MNEITLMKQLENLSTKIDELKQPRSWLNVAQTASYLNISESKIRKLISNGKIPFNRVGGKIIFHIRKLDAWVLSGGDMKITKSHRKLLDILE